MVSRFIAAPWALACPRLLGAASLQSSLQECRPGGGLGPGCLRAPALGAHVPLCRSPGILRAALFVFASTCAWYSGYLLAELIPDASLATAVYSIRSIGERPILRGQYRGSQWVLAILR